MDTHLQNPKGSNVARAYTPEELELLFEDALLMCDHEAVADLFEEGAVLSTGTHPPIRGGAAIGRLAVTLRSGENSYVADLKGLIQARDVALIATGQGVNVMRRGSDGGWRYAISLQFLTSITNHLQGVEKMQHQGQTLKPLVVPGEQGEARWWLNCLAVIKATAADTGGQMTIIEVTEGPGSEVPLHVHHREDEGFWILEGDVIFEVGDATIEARTGDYVFGPRDIPHRYTVGAAGCRMLFICTPAGFEELVRAMSVPADSRTLPPPSNEMPDFARIARIAQAHGAELLM